MALSWVSLAALVESKVSSSQKVAAHLSGVRRGVSASGGVSLVTPRVEIAITAGVLVWLASAYVLSVIALIVFLGWWTLPFTLGWGTFCITWFADAVSERMRQNG